MIKLQNKSVLVLGWEFPPRMVGGLAIATYGIVEALSHFLHVILILPFKDEQTPKIPNVTIYGLNQIESDFDDKKVKYLNQKKAAFFSNKEIQSYPLFNEIGYSEWDSTQTNINIKSFLDIFKSEEIYGWGLWQKIMAYGELVSVIAEFIHFDVVHCHDWLTFNAGKRVKAIYQKPLCLHVHALETDRISSEARNEVYEIERSAMIDADRVFPVSGYTKNEIIKNYGINADKIIPIYNSIDNKKIHRWKHKIPQRIVTFLGRITSQKGPQFLFETAAKVIEQFKDVRFVVSGKGDLLMQLVSASAQKQLSKYFFFTGFINREEVDALLAASDVYFMPSVSEPFGLTALEAARAGVPCVLTKQSGASEILRSALTADYWDTDLFAKHIIALLKDDKFRQQKIEAAKHELEHVTWFGSAAKIAQEYSLLLQ